MGRSEHFFGAVPELAAGAQAYAARLGNTRPSLDNVRVNPALGRRLAGEYLAAPDYDERAIPAFQAMREQTNRQFDYLTRGKGRGGLGVDVTAHEYDPYSASKTEADPEGYGTMMGELREGRLRVMHSSVTGGHPFFSDDTNTKFRAVHDAFGHGGTGYDFSRHGEEAAWRAHASMYSPEARPALATETRGQNSALNYGPNPGQFHPQKIALLRSGLR